MNNKFDFQSLKADIEALKNTISLAESLNEQEQGDSGNGFDEDKQALGRLLEFVKSVETESNSPEEKRVEVHSDGDWKVRHIPWDKCWIEGGRGEEICVSSYERHKDLEEIVRLHNYQAMKRKIME